MISGLGNLDACPWLEFVPLKLFNGASSLFIKVYRCTVYKSGRLTAAATTFNQISEPMTIVMLISMMMHGGDDDDGGEDDDDDNDDDHAW